MPAIADWLNRRARRLLLVTAALLALGALLFVTGLPLVGWSVYVPGHLGLLAALPAMAAVYRASFDWLSWGTFGGLYVGVMLGVPVALIVLSHYAQDPGAREAVMPYVVTPLGTVAGLVTWVGLGLFGLATLRVRALPRGASVLFVVAALLGLPAELRTFTVFAWGLGVVVASIALVWLAPEPVAARRVAQS
jgi:hypothetical protein